MSLLFERLYPTLGAGLLAGAYFFIPKLNSYVFPDTIPNLLSAIVSIGGIAVGFLATAKAILISIDDRPIIVRLKEAKIYRRVMGYLRSAMRWSFAVAMASAAALVFDYRGIAVWDRPHIWGTAIWLFLVTGAILSYIRVSRIWYTLLDVIDVDPVAEPEKQKG